MFEVSADKTIHLTRGDIAVLEITSKVNKTEDLVFQVGDIVRFSICQYGKFDQVVLRKEVEITEETTVAVINLTKTDTKIGDVIHKPKDYWYEVELNPDTMPQTLIGYDTAGPKVFRLYPEGDDS
jgi:hypothetical protein